jgi:uncharacterized damage-inducible protein DinB
MDPTFLENYRFLARYNRWMNQRLVAACDALTDAERKADRGAFFKSIHHTVTHLLLADKMWLARFAAQDNAMTTTATFTALTPERYAMPPGADYTSNAYPDWTHLKQERDALDAAIEQWLADMPPAFLTSMMRYANTKGVPRAHPAWQALTHFFNHQTHHRGQATTLLTQAGVDMGVTDLIALV